MFAALVDLIVKFGLGMFNPKGHTESDFDTEPLENFQEEFIYSKNI